MTNGFSGIVLCHSWACLSSAVFLPRGSSLLGALVVKASRFVSRVPLSVSRIYTSSRIMCSTKHSRYGSMPILLGLGNPLLDMTITASMEFMQRYSLEPNDQIISDGLGHRQMMDEMQREHKPLYVPGGATLNSIRVAQWILQSSANKNIPSSPASSSGECARQQGSSIFLGCVGEDKEADLLRESCARLGVEARFQVHPTERTGVCAAVITGEDRSLITELGAANYFSAQELGSPDNWAAVEKSTVYYIGGFMLPVSKESIIKIAEHSSSCQPTGSVSSGRRRKLFTMNINAPFVCDHFAEVRERLFPHVDVLIGNSAEYRALARSFKLEACRVSEGEEMDLSAIAKELASAPKLHPAQPRIVIITRGAKPTILCQDGGKPRIYQPPPVPKELIVDTTGCGDAFMGGFLSQLLLGRDLGVCMRCGTYAASEVIKHVGCNYPERANFEV